MSTDRSFDRFPVLAFPASGWVVDNLWSAESTYSEASPLPPICMPDRDSELVLECTGTIWDSEDLDLLALRAGFPEPDGGAIAWKKSSDPATAYRGWDAPNAISHWEVPGWSTGPGGTSYAHPHAVTLSDGTVLVACHRLLATPPLYRVSVLARAPSTGAWTTVDVTTQSTPPPDWYPCLCVLPNDRVLLFHWVTSGNEAQVQVWYSDDKGGTWASWQPYCLKVPVAIDYVGTPRELRRLRAAYSNGQILLIAGLYDESGAVYNRIKQWCSTDLGASFFEVYEGDGSVESEAMPDVIVYDGRFQVYYLESTDNVRMREIAEASVPLDSVEPVEIPFTSVVVFVPATEAGDLAAVADPDGSIYVLCRDAQDEYCCIQRSSDGGQTWGLMSKSTRGAGTAGVWWDGHDTGTYPINFCAAAEGSRILAIHTWEASPGTNDNSLCVAYLGGWSTVTLPALELFPRASDRIGWTDTWLPLDLPSDLSWSTYGAGTPTISNGTLQITTTAANTRYYEKSSTLVPGTIDEGIGCRFRVKVSSGGSLAGEDVSVRIRLADGVDDYEASIRFTGTEFRLYDVNGAAAIGADQTFGTSATEVEVLIWVGRGKVRTWYRLPSSMPDREWTVGPSSTTLVNDSVTPSANNMIRWGNCDIGAGSVSVWTEYHWVSDEYAGLGLQDGFTNPDDLFPRPLSSGRIYLYGGAEISVADGPVGTGDSWSLAARADYSVSRIFPADTPSPTDGWRSLPGETTAHYIAVAHDATLLGTVESYDENDAVALVLLGCNWRSGYLQGYDVGTSAWVNVATIDMASGLALPYTRQGTTIIPAAGGTYPYLFHSEVVGWTAQLSGAARRRVVWQSEGVWGTGSYKRARLGIAADGSEPASGTMYLWSPNAVLLVHLAGATYAGWRIAISSQATLDSDHRIGTAFLASCAVPGRRYEGGWVVETQPNTDIRTATDGTRTSRVLGSRRRVVELPWTALLPMEALHDVPASPGYQMGTSTGGGLAIATANDVHPLLEGVLERTEGGHLPLAFLWAARKSDGTMDTQTFNRRHQFLYARAIGSLRLEGERGLRGFNEVGRSPGLVLEEEL